MMCVSTKSSDKHRALRCQRAMRGRSWRRRAEARRERGAGHKAGKSFATRAGVVLTERTRFARTLASGISARALSRQRQRVRRTGEDRWRASAAERTWRAHPHLCPALQRFGQADRKPVRAPRPAGHLPASRLRGPGSPRQEEPDGRQAARTVSGVLGGVLRWPAGSDLRAEPNPTVRVSVVRVRRWFPGARALHDGLQPL